MIQLNNIEVIFGKNTANENLALKIRDFQINSGDFLTVIGSNGAGKSTFLNLISGRVRQNSGDVYLNGKNISKTNETDRSDWCARVFQDPLTGTYGQLTIEENFALAMDRGSRRNIFPALSRERRAKFHDLLAPLEMNLEHRLKERMELLSGGQRQAISLLMATIKPMKILLLDEMTAALDPAMTNFIMKLTSKIVETNKLTVLMVTHSMEQALAYGNRLIMMHKGEIIIDVGPEEKKGLTKDRLMDLFKQTRGQQLDQDNLLLSNQ